VLGVRPRPLHARGPALDDAGADVVEAAALVARRARARVRGQHPDRVVGEQRQVLLERPLVDHVLHPRDEAVDGRLVTRRTATTRHGTPLSRLPRR
jgi:hypothetical protein